LLSIITTGIGFYALKNTYDEKCEIGPIVTTMGDMQSQTTYPKEIAFLICLSSNFPMLVKSTVGMIFLVGGSYSIVKIITGV